MSALRSNSAISHGAEAIVGDRPDAVARLRTFHTLDALRGVAALAVVLFHTAFIYGIPRPAEGQIAVDLFFVMSGFIIAYRYETDLRAGLGLGTFFRIRLIRLYPLFLLGTVLGLVPALIALASGRGDALYHGLIASFPLALVMLPSYFTFPKIDELYPLNYVAWSLALELVINMVYAATVRLWTPRRLALVMAVAFVGLALCAFVYKSITGGYAWANAPVGLARVAYGFFAGVLIFKLHRHPALRVRMPWWLLLALALAIFFVEPPVGKAIWELYIIALIVPLIVVGAIANEPPRAFQGFCALAGIFSYVVYSLHTPLVGFFLRAEERLHVNLEVQTPPEALVFTGLLIGVSIAAHVLYDKPVRRWLSRRRVSLAARTVTPAGPNVTPA